MILKNLTIRSYKERAGRMYRIGQIFHIRPEMKEGYKIEHDNIWPELVEVIKQQGIKTYSIFFRKDGTLFSYIEVENLGEFLKNAKKFAKTEVSLKWEKHMREYFIEVSEDTGAPVMEELEEVFHLDFKKDK